MNQRSFPIGRVAKACDNYLQEQTENMKRLQEPDIQKEMKGGWFSKPKTREQAIESLYGDLWSNYNMLQLNWDFHTSAITKLRALCQATFYMSDEYILLDSDTAYILRKYL